MKINQAKLVRMDAQAQEQMGNAIAAPSPKEASVDKVEGVLELAPQPGTRLFEIEKMYDAFSEDNKKHQ